jgi:hypothetical protein
MIWTIYDLVLFPNNIILLVTIDKLNPNPILININKLKPYRFIEDQTFQHVLAKPNDFLFGGEIFQLLV